MKRRERIYIAIIAALLIHALVLVMLHEIPHRRAVAPTIYSEVDLIQPIEDLESEPEKTLEQTLADRIREDVANLVADANAEKSSERRSTISQQSRNRIAEEVERDLRALERETFEGLEQKRREQQASNQESLENGGTESASGNESSAQEQYDYFGKAYNGNVTAEYDLPGREARSIHIPGYKCKGGGTVRVNIAVNQTGQVVEASIDLQHSSYSGDCLPTEALNSARKSVFFVKSEAPKKQVGSITYRFIPQ